MNDYVLLYVLSPLLFLASLIWYFRLAERHAIIDKPNERSSHFIPTVRGGGIVFVLSVLLCAVINSFEYSFFLVGFLMLSVVSFIDDIMEMSKRVRLSIQLMATVLLILQVTEGNIVWWQWVLYLLLCTSTINFYNFMDGINGITAFYSLVVFGSFLYLHQTDVLVVNESIIILPILALAVFSFFNARVKARCFAGDVGSVSLSFVVIFLLGTLCWQQQNLMYIWLLGIYGVDTILTIIQRIFKRQNILQGHRLHLYQLMANEGGVPHVMVSAIYALAQLAVNVLLLGYIIPGDFNLFWVNLLMSLFFVVVYVPVKYGFSLKVVKDSKAQRKTQSLAGKQAA